MRYAIPSRANGAIFFTLLVLHALVLFVLPALLIQSHLWLLLFLPLAWLNIVHWGLIHEAIHKILFAHPRRNEIGGRILAILMGPSFQVLRFGHLMHHKLNRRWNAEKLENPSFATSLNYYFHLLAGLYLSEIVSGMLFTFLPRPLFMKLGRATFLRDYEEVAVAGERFFYLRGNIHPVRADMLIALALYGAAFYTYGAQWPVLLAFMAIRALVISFMDNIYHFGTPADNSKAGKELALPRFASILLLHGNYHETHHTNPDVPWNELPTVHRMQAREFDGDFVAHGLMQFVRLQLTTVMASA